MGLGGGLTKEPESKPVASIDLVETAAQEFISRAAVTSTSLSPSPSPTGLRRGRPPKKASELRKTAPTTFSLDKKVNRDIDRLTLVHKNLKLSRSDIIRAGVVALQGMDRDELLKLLERVSRSETIADGEPDLS
jgi:Arc/MetJ-type ribon-helix-helix transcriptional regulator